MEFLTLNLYGILPSKDNQYINAVLGLSHLRFDHSIWAIYQVREKENKLLHQ